MTEKKFHDSTYRDVCFPSPLLHAFCASIAWGLTISSSCLGDCRWRCIMVQDEKSSIC